MFPDYSLYQIMLIPIVLLALTIYVNKKFMWKKNEGHERVCKVFYVEILCFGLFWGILLLLLPSTAVLGSFNYPDSVNDVINSEKLLKYLQEYNKTIVRTTDVVKMFLLSSIIFLLNINEFTKLWKGNK